MTSPGLPPQSPATECAAAYLTAFDFEFDGDVDLRDFASFQLIFDLAP